MVPVTVRAHQWASYWTRDANTGLTQARWKSRHQRLLQLNVSDQSRSRLCLTFIPFSMRVQSHPMTAEVRCFDLYRAWYFLHFQESLDDQFFFAQRRSNAI